MRKSRKSIVIAGTVTGVLVGGAAFAYWSTLGEGTGSGATTTGVTKAVTIEQNTLTAMYPGDAPQAINLKATNGDAKESVYVASISGVLSVTPATGKTCDATNFKVNNNALASDGKFTTSWGGIELSHGASDTQNGVATIQFNDKAENQDGCKNASVSIAYSSN